MDFRTNLQTAVMLRWKRKEAQSSEVGEFPASWDALKSACGAPSASSSTARDEQCLACCYMLELPNDQSQEDSDSEDMDISSSTARLGGTGKHGRSPVVPVVQNLDISHM